MLLFVASSAQALGPRYISQKVPPACQQNFQSCWPAIYQEFLNVYHDLSYPTIGYGTAQQFNVTNSSITNGTISNLVVASTTTVFPSLSINNSNPTLGFNRYTADGTIYYPTNAGWQLTFNAAANNSCQLEHYNGAGTFLNFPIFISSNGYVGINQQNAQFWLDINGTENLVNPQGGPFLYTNGSTMFVSTKTSEGFGLGALQNIKVELSSYSWASGWMALNSHVTGIDDTAWGAGALQFANNDRDNTCGGTTACQSITTAGECTSVGSSGLASNGTGWDDSCFAVSCMQNAINPTHDTCGGVSCLQVDTNGYNACLGSQCLFNTKASSSAALGMASGYNNITGTGDLWLGFQSGAGTTPSNLVNAGCAGYQCSVYANNTFQIGGGTGTSTAQNVRASTFTADWALYLPQLAPEMLFVDATGLVKSGAVNLTSQATGVLQAAQEPAHTGDVTNAQGSLTLTAATNQGNIKVFTSSITDTNANGINSTYETSGGSLTARNIASGTQCIHADSSGHLTGTGGDCAPTSIHNVLINENIGQTNATTNLVCASTITITTGANPIRVWYTGIAGNGTLSSQFNLFVLVDSVEFGSKPIIRDTEFAANGSENGSFNVQTAAQTAASHNVCVGIYETAGGSALLGNQLDGGVYNQFGVEEIK